MSTNTLLEERLASLEVAVAELQSQLQMVQPTNWLEQITGSFEDEPAFGEVFEPFGKKMVYR